MFLYVAYSKDKFSLPLCAFDTCKELALFLGASYQSVILAVRKHGKVKGYEVAQVYY